MNKKIEKIEFNPSDDANIWFGLMDVCKKTNQIIDVVNGIQGEEAEADPFVKELEAMKEIIKYIDWAEEITKHQVYCQAIDDIISRFKGRVKIIK